MCCVRLLQDGGAGKLRVLRAVSWKKPRRVGATNGWQELHQSRCSLTWKEAEKQGQMQAGGCARSAGSEQGIAYQLAVLRHQFVFPVAHSA